MPRPRDERTSGVDRTGRGELRLKLPRGFRLDRAICSYGYFLLAPNMWDPTTRTFHRPLRDEAGGIVRTIWLQEPGKRILRVFCEPAVKGQNAAVVRKQIARILRLDEELPGWGRLCPTAAREGFGRLFRSPTLFEDVVKTMTGCNMSWPGTIRMNLLLCVKVGEGAFPTPEQLAGVTPRVLQRSCKVGYRAERIVMLARRVKRGELNLSWFESPKRSNEELYEGLRQIYGIGDYAAANLCHLLGRYERVAVDSETHRHFRQVHAVRARGDLKPEAMRKRILRHYERYAPYQFLGYWYELWRAYERVAGPAQTWQPESHGHLFTASVLNKPDKSEG